MKISNKHIIYCCLVCLFFLSKHSHAQQTTRIEIVNSNEMSFDQNNYGNIKKLIGNVILKNENATMYCDSAYIFDEDQNFEAFSNVKIVQGDSVEVRSNHILYEGNNKLAHLDGNVSLKQGKMKIKTEKLDYSLRDKKAYYKNYATLNNGESILTSLQGEYWTQTKDAYFKNRVKLKNPEYILTTDTLIYNTKSEIAHFNGPTHIITKTDSLYAENGWYDTKKEEGTFTQKAYIKTGLHILNADTVHYQKKMGIGTANGHVVYTDEKEKLLLTGETGRYQKINNYIQLNGHAHATKYMKDDTLFVWADTLHFEGDSIKKNRVMTGWKQVNLFKKDIQAVADTIIYQIDDSLVTLYQHPIIWNLQNQLFADSIYIGLSDETIHDIILDNHGFIISQEKGAHFNQIKGDTMKGFFTRGILDQVWVKDAAECIYYAKEDSNHYIGVNRIECPEMWIYLKDEKVSGIKFLGKSNASLLPIKKVNPLENRLKGFEWYDKKRPVTQEFKVFNTVLKK